MNSISLIIANHAISIKEKLNTAVILYMGEHVWAVWMKREKQKWKPIKFIVYLWDRVKGQVR